MESRQRLLWADLLRIVSIYAVIIIHSAAPFLVKYNQLGEATWWIGNIYDSLARWCVPVFIMLSGALVLGKTYESLGQFFNRRLRKVLVPFIIWSAIYFWWDAYSGDNGVQVASFFAQIFIEPTYYHLWFLYVILGLYFLAPVLSIYLNNAPARNIWYLVALWFVLAAILPVLEYFLEIETYYSTGSAQSTITLSGYFILGYLLKDVQMDFTKMAAAFIMFLTGLALTALGTYYLTLQNGGDFHVIFYEYFSFNVVLMSVSVFLLVKNIVAGEYESSAGVGKILQAVSASVLGVYLIHALVLEVLRDGLLGWKFEPTQIHVALGIPLFALLIFLISFVAVWILRQIPIIKQAVP